MKRSLIVLLAVMLLGSLIAGCAQESGSSDPTQKPTQKPGQTQAATDAAGETAAPAPDVNAGQYPIVEEPLTLTWWMGLNSDAVGAGIKDFNEVLCFQKAEEITGIHIDFQHPTLGQESTQFNLMLVSGELPDMITYSWASYNGGPEKAISDNIIIDHRPYIEEYAVHFNEFIEAHPGCERYFLTDSGKAYCIPGMKTITPEGQDYCGPDERELYYEADVGLVLRADWLADLGLEPPTTIDEWYNVLTAFKNEKGAVAPFTTELGKLKQCAAFFTAYGVTTGFFEGDNQTVYFGPYMPEYKDALALLAKWYSEDLLDPDFSTNDTKAVDAKVLGNQTGSWSGYSAGGVGIYMKSGKQADPDFDLVGVSLPSLNKGEPVMGGVTHPNSNTLPVITTANEHPVESIRYIDFFYSDEGDTLFNWGVEGISYQVVDGQYQFTEAISEDPDGIPAQQVMRRYIFWGWGGAMETRFALYATYGEEACDRIVSAKKLWGEVSRTTMLPPCTIASDKSSAYAAIMSDINTYVNEQMLQFIMGTVSLDEFDNYIAQLKAMGMESAINIQQEALDRYYAR